MSDPMMRPGEPAAGTLGAAGKATSGSGPATHPSPLATSPRRAAGAAATRLIGSRRVRIVEMIRKRGDVTIFEAAEALGIGDNQMSGQCS